jgi:hypothetical protein
MIQKAKQKVDAFNKPKQLTSKATILASFDLKIETGYNI